MGRMRISRIYVLKRLCSYRSAWQPWLELVQFPPLHEEGSSYGPHFVAYSNALEQAETFTGPPGDLKKRYHIGTDGEAHGLDGPLKISYSHWYNELHLQFMDALVNLGVPVNKDPVWHAPDSTQNIADPSTD